MVLTVLFALPIYVSARAEDKNGQNKPSHIHRHIKAGETCFICDSALREKGRLWCEEHARYEDRCWVCHPDSQNKTRPFCAEHNLYADEWLFCHPEDKKPASSDGSGKTHPKAVLLCNEHNVPEHEYGICQPDLAQSLEFGESLKVRFASNNIHRNKSTIRAKGSKQ